MQVVKLILMRHTAEKFPQLIQNFKGGEVKESNGFQYMLKIEKY